MLLRERLRLWLSSKDMVHVKTGQGRYITIVVLLLSLPEGFLSHLGALLIIFDTLIFSKAVILLYILVRQELVLEENDRTVEVFKVISF